MESLNLGFKSSCETKTGIQSRVLNHFWWVFKARFKAIVRVSKLGYVFEVRFQLCEGKPQYWDLLFLDLIFRMRLAKRFFEGLYFFELSVLVARRRSRK